jgi:pyruvate dehydrogenase E2 component (dihydrolipoamide acetyltransferase)
MQIKTPDIGVDQANVAEVLVKVGDRIEVDDSIVVLESDKATVEVPATSAGVVKSILVNQGDDVTEGTALIELEAEGTSGGVTEAQEADAAQKTSENTPTELPDREIQQEISSHQPNSSTQAAQPSESESSSAATVEVKLPDIGVEKALVGELLVQVGDDIQVDQSIAVVESDKATVEVPSTVAGKVQSITVKEGDSVKEGVVLITVRTAEGSAGPVSEKPSVQPATEKSASQRQAATSVENSSSAESTEIEVTVPIKPQSLKF